MLQSKSIINFFNNSVNIVSHVKSDNKLWVNSLRNARLFLSGRGNTFHDSYNFISSGCYTKKVNKLSNIQKILTNLYIVQWAHLKFRGKSYRIRNFCRYNKFTYNLGYSHWTKLKLLSRWAFFKRRRQTYVLYSYFLKDFSFFKRFIPFVRVYNCYTMRGLRLKKQPIIRRFGKISQHISNLH